MIRGHDSPPIYRDMVEQLGYQVAQKLVDHYGGARVYIPLAANLRAEHDLVKIFGYQMARFIAKTYGGRLLEVPTKSTEARHDRNELILSAHRSGARANTIARQFGLSRSTVDRVIAKARLCGHLPNVSKS